ncbi:MAG: response regulator [Longimicrobiales bacterium]|nr:response regulator [Longimicrobiales bacterium]
MTMDGVRAPGPLRILVVEDAMDQALFVRSLFEGRGYSVQTAQDGAHALDLYDAGEFDLVVTDLNLPGMDGFDLTRELKKPERGTIVIAITGYTHQTYTESAFRAGVDHLLHKPIDEEDLLEQIRDYFPELHPRDERPRPILAVSTRPGDVTFGCAGTLLRHREHGRELMLYILGRGPHGDLGEACARVAAETLGVQLLFAEAATDDVVERQLLLERVIREFDPSIAYIPSRADDDANRREVHRLSWSGLGEVPEVFGYLTPTSTLDFKPDVFEIVGPQMSTKLDAMLAYADLGEFALTGRFAQAAARWWGRQRNFAEVEPFEHLKR